DLVLRNLQTGNETRYGNVVSYAFTENGQWLIYAAANKDSTADGLYAIRTATGDSIALLTGPGDYKKITYDESNTHLAFIANRDSFRADQQEYALYYWRIGSNNAAKELARSKTTGIPPNWWVSEHGKLSFSENGKRLFFGTAPIPEPEKDDETPDDEKVVVDIWNWRDPYLQPMQLKEVKDERERTYRAVVHLNNGKIVQLATKNIPRIRLGSEGNADVVVGYSTLPYRRLISWDPYEFYDSYIIDVNTGIPNRILTKSQADVYLSPESQYIYWWDRAQSAWYVQNVKNQLRVNVSKNIPHPVYNELNDRPSPPDAHGNGGWTKDDEEFLVYDRYDIWLTNPNGRKAPVNITEGVGRETETRFRYVRLNREERARDPKAELLFSGFNLKTKAIGYYRDRIRSSGKPRVLIQRDKSFTNLRKAKNADILLFRQSSFKEYPNLWISDLNFQNARKISDVNPQQKNYLWGTEELVEWTSLDGKTLQGILYKPENFDKIKSYPMVVFFYEKMSNQLHAHRTPSPSSGNIDFALYVSQGYLVFIPDIPYKIGFPGESAVHAVVSGITHLINRGFVDKDRIGVEGHSWGGYQTTFLITRTHIFKAAVAGALVSNMTSAYGGIRWNSGLSRMMQYEKHQSRIGGSLWEKPLYYIENSPIFWADKIQTPLLMLHNENDGAVPWEQSIELFVAMRRLNKPAWLINYNKEIHGIRNRHARKDWSIRLLQFFDHYLKDAPAPAWLAEGIPAIQKGKTLGLELIEEKQ
ncbi:MAG: prolyl oligopeptidase family serine peptidase, partial [Candidatus Latescibacteria bacterium]|nr:prolyl oligopeptidase family serine peptidase [Candidatus Latescibacterota bacterium]